MSKPLKLGALLSLLIRIGGGIPEDEPIIDGNLMALRNILKEVDKGDAALTDAYVESKIDDAKAVRATGLIPTMPKDNAFGAYYRQLYEDLRKLSDEDLRKHGRGVVLIMTLLTEFYDEEVPSADQEPDVEVEKADYEKERDAARLARGRGPGWTRGRGRGGTGPGSRRPGGEQGMHYSHF